MNLDTSPVATLIAMSKKVKHNEATERNKKGAASNALREVAEKLRRYLNLRKGGGLPEPHGLH
jgi:hypothetical protein